MTDYKENLKTAIQDHLLRGKGAKTVSIDVVNPSDEKVASEKAVVTLINVFKDYVKSGTDPLLTDILGTGELLESKLKSKGVDCDFGQHSSGKDCLYALAGKIDDIPDWEDCGYLYWNSGTSQSLVTSDGSLTCTSDAVVDYGDGTVEKLDGRFNHTYTSSGTFKVRFKGLTGINDAELFKNKTAITGELYMPEITTITNKSNNIFYGCSGLSSVSFPALTTIETIISDNFMFGLCSGLSSVSFPALTTITCVGHINIFYGCSGLSSVSFPALTTISSTSGGNYMFGLCSGLSSVSFPALTTITSKVENYMFVLCSGLSSVSFPALTTIKSNYGNNNMFRFCSGLSNINFGELTTINRTIYMFGDPPVNLKIIKFNKTTPPVFDDSYPFSECNGTIIIVPNGSKSAYETAPNYPNPSTNTYVEVHA